MLEVQEISSPMGKIAHLKPNLPTIKCMQLQSKYCNVAQFPVCQIFYTCPIYLQVS